jgi:acyl-CoA thioester hydrolase
MLEKLIVTMENGGNSEDLSRFRVINNIYKADGTHAVRITSIGGWLSLNERKLIEPPDLMKEAWSKLDKSEDFEELRSSIKK